MPKVCKRGHEQQVGNIGAYGHCLACIRFRRTGLPESNLFCRRGHLRSPENLYKNGWCKVCSKEREKTPEQKARQLINSQKYQIKRLYGLSIDQWNDMLVAQNWRCAICKVHQKDVKRTFNIDHNH